MIEPISVSRDIAGRKLTIESGKLAKQANGSVIVRYGETVVLVTVVTSPQAREGVDFLPLTVDYEERLYAAGKIPGGFIRREGRPTTEATLAARLIDRTIRPLLPKTWRREIQVMITVLSAAQENDQNLLGIIRASTALSMSEIPFEGPVSGVTVGYLDGQMVLNPILPQLAGSSLDLVICSTRKNAVMVEAGAREISEDLIGEALKFGHDANQVIIDIQEEFLKNCRKPKLEAPPAWDNQEVIAAVKEVLAGRLDTCIGMPGKQERQTTQDSLLKELQEKLAEKYSAEDISLAFDKLFRALIRSSILEKSLRPDGRGITNIRPISCEVVYCRVLMVIGIFNRGENSGLDYYYTGCCQ